MTSLLVLGGCNATGSRTKTAPRPAPVEQQAAVDMSGLSPLEQHMRARRMVNPADVSESHAYTSKVPTAAEIKAAKNMIVPPRKPHAPNTIFSKVASVFSSDTSERTAATPAPVIQARAKPVSAPVVARKPDPAPQAPPRVVTSNSGVNVTGVRIGQHGEKTRIVLDVSAAARFDYQMDNDKNVLVVQLANVGWSAAVKQVFSTHPLLLAYLAKPMPAGGTFLAIKMKRPAEIVFKTTYPPNGTSGFRIVFDVAPA